MINRYRRLLFVLVQAEGGRYSLARSIEGEQRLLEWFECGVSDKCVLNRLRIYLEVIVLFYYLIWLAATFKLLATEPLHGELAARGSKARFESHRWSVRGN